MGEHPGHAVRLEIEQAAAVGNDGELVLVGPDRNSVQRLCEQIDAGRGVQREKLLANRRGQLRLHLVKSHDDIDGLGREPRRDRAEIDQVEAEEAPGKCKIVAQEVEPPEQLIVVRDQGLLFLEADLPNHAGLAGHDDRIAERVEHAKIDAATMREELLV